MRRVRKTTLVLCLGAIAMSGLFTPASGGETKTIEETAAAEATIAVEAALPYVLEEPLPATEASAAQEFGAPEPELTAAVWNPPLICPAGDDIDDLAISGSILNIMAGLIPAVRILLPSEATIVGIASYYDEPQETASGEPFDPDAFTAAAQLEIRDKFGGIQFGRNYQPAYGVAEYDGKKVILKFNDVGPLRPGRKFDLSRAAMAYFDGLEKGLLPEFKVTPLPLGQIYPPGPVTDVELAALGIGSTGVAVAAVDTAVMPGANAIEPEPPLSLPAEAAIISARLYTEEAAGGEG